VSSAVGLERLDLGPQRFDLAAIRGAAGLVCGALFWPRIIMNIISPIATGQASTASV
jgi:hypothetical protein